MFIPDPDLDFLPIPDPEVKKAPDPESGSATLFTRQCYRIALRDFPAGGVSRLEADSRAER